MKDTIIGYIFTSYSVFNDIRISFFLFSRHVCGALKVTFVADHPEVITETYLL